MVAATFSSRLVTILRQGCLLSHCFIVAAMLTIPAMASSSLMNRSRYRLPDSMTSVNDIQKVLNLWWTAVGLRDASKLLRPVVTAWPSRGTPSPKELVADTVYSLAVEMARVDPTIHPRHSRIVCALIAEHGSQQGTCMGTARRPEFEAMELSRTMLKAFSKYRDLVRDPCKKSAVMRRCTSDELIKLEALLALIVLPTCHDDTTVVDTGDDMFDAIVAADSGGSSSHAIVAADTRGSSSHRGGIVAAHAKGPSPFKWDIDDIAAGFGHSVCVVQSVMFLNRFLFFIYNICFGGGRRAEMVGLKLNLF